MADDFSTHSRLRAHQGDVTHTREGLTGPRACLEGSREQCQLMRQGARATRHTGPRAGPRLEEVPTRAYHGEKAAELQRGWCPGRQGRVDVKLPDCDDEAVPRTRRRPLASGGDEMSRSGERDFSN